MEIGERVTSKQNASSAINHAHAKVRVTQKVPDTHTKKNWWRRCKRLLRQRERKLRNVQKVAFQLATEPLPLPTKPAWTPIFGPEGYYQRYYQGAVVGLRCLPAWQTVPFHHFCPLGPDWGRCPLPIRWLWSPSLPRFNGLVCRIRFLALQGRREQQVALSEKQQLA